MTAHKSISVNLNGTAYQLDETAFGLVDDYLKSVEEAFSDDLDKSELVSDFEQAIADKLEAAGISGRKVASKKLVEEIIDKIGPVDGKEANQPSNKNSKHTKKSPGFEAPKIVTGKRVYKSSDDKIIDGVCSGLGLYFGIDPTWVRLGTVIFALATGVGPLVVGYIILSIVLPEAKTAEQRLEAQGKPLDASALIFQTKERLEKAGESAKHVAAETSRSLTHSNGWVSLLRNVLDRIFRILSHIIRRILSVIGAGVAAALFIATVVGGVYGMMVASGNLESSLDWPLFTNSHTGFAAGWWFFLTATIALPILGLVWLFASIDGTKFVRKTTTTTHKLTLVLAWLFCLMGFTGLNWLNNSDLRAWNTRHSINMDTFGIYTDDYSYDEKAFDTSPSPFRPTVTMLSYDSEKCQSINVMPNESYYEAQSMMARYDLGYEFATGTKTASALREMCGSVDTVPVVLDGICVPVSKHLDQAVFMTKSSLSEYRNQSSDKKITYFWARNFSGPDVDQTDICQPTTDSKL